MLGPRITPGDFHAELVEGTLAPYAFHAVVGVKHYDGIVAIIQAVDGVEEAAEMEVEIANTFLVIGHFFADLWGIFIGWGDRCCFNVFPTITVQGRIGAAILAIGEISAPLRAVDFDSAYIEVEGLGLALAASEEFDGVIDGDSGAWISWEVFFKTVIFAEFAGVVEADEGGVITGGIHVIDDGLAIDGQAPAAIDEAHEAAGVGVVAGPGTTS